MLGGGPFWSAERRWRHFAWRASLGCRRVGASGAAAFDHEAVERARRDQRVRGAYPLFDLAPTRRVEALVKGHADPSGAAQVVYRRLHTGALRRTRVVRFAA